jgi:ribosomal protein L31E
MNDYSEVQRKFQKQTQHSSNVHVKELPESKIQENGGITDFQTTGDQNKIINGQGAQTELKMKEIKDKEVLPKCKFLILKNLSQIIIKLFLNEQVNEEDLELLPEEKDLLMAILKKKKFPITNTDKLTVPLLNSLSKQRLTKKNEDMLKFVVKKCVKHMQQEFLRKVKLEHLEGKHLMKGVTLEDIKQNKDKYFYQYFFGEVSEREGIPIQHFYHFRSWKNRFLKNIPKSVTRQSLNLWKKNPIFIDQMKTFIKESLIKSFYAFNANKIQIMIRRWERIMEQNGRVPGIKKVLSKFTCKGSKLPWTLSEAESAAKYTLRLLS